MKKNLLKVLFGAALLVMGTQVANAQEVYKQNGVVVGTQVNTATQEQALKAQEKALKEQQDNLKQQEKAAKEAERVQKQAEKEQKQADQRQIRDRQGI